MSNPFAQNQPNYNFLSPNNSTYGQPVDMQPPVNINVTQLPSTCQVHTNQSTMSSISNSRWESPPNMQKSQQQQSGPRNKDNQPAWMMQGTQH